VTNLKARAEAWQNDPHAHPWTCNGGNPDFDTHHDHEVRLVPMDDHFECPECGRQQPYGPFEIKMLGGTE